MRANGRHRRDVYMRTRLRASLFLGVAALFVAAVVSPGAGVV